MHAVVEIDEVRRTEVPHVCVGFHGEVEAGGVGVGLVEPGGVATRSVTEAGGEEFLRDPGVYCEGGDALEVGGVGDELVEVGEEFGDAGVH